MAARVAREPWNPAAAPGAAHAALEAPPEAFEVACEARPVPQLALAAPPQARRAPVAAQGVR